MAEASSVLEINTENIVGYLREKTDLFNKTDPISVVDLSAEGGATEDEGYVNFIFRVAQGGRSYIVKQARPYLRISGIVDSLPPQRNYLEYLSFVLRDGIAKTYVPHIYFVDAENNVFMMEDLFSNNMRVMRFQLNEGREFSNFPAQAGTFLARNHFYTSELFLEKEVFRALQMEFANLSMRAVMEDVVMLKRDSESDEPLNFLGQEVWKDPALRLALVEARDILLKKGECLIHGDFHTSNLFIDDENMRVIDMEYSFIGPFSYDLGYLLANFVSQYAAFMFNEKFAEAKRRSYQRYLLSTIQGVLDSYFATFKQCFENDAKPLYRETPGYLEQYLFIEILQETLAILASANLFRIINLSRFPDFDNLEDPKSRLLAQSLSVAIDEHLLRNRKSVTTTQMAVDAILTAQQKYMNSLARSDMRWR